ncbi:ABC transporter permease [Defluviimonas sp. WL0002]|uniref:ABC transporter permease n=1 Tax=Albidovulum marisflavi TaxID=2984159 RepID=A0ABT2Z9B7_9RHOB|nr:ABC transporter permease [Defluviimonas sp. WL0002]MCV2867361.1 ABC transporter permease [Defluviimonas sp. WL0002]
MTYVLTVRKIKGRHQNPAAALFSSMFQVILMLGFFYLMSTLFGVRRAGIHGDFVLFLLSGIFTFMTFNKALGAVSNAEGPGSAMMAHAPMNTVASIISSAVSTLYLQVAAIVIIGFFYHVLVGPVDIDDPVGFVAMVLFSWASGSALGLVFLALSPWAPKTTGILRTVFLRANMLFSGKMFIANTMPYNLHHWFEWNPLFHIVDQARGYAFINYEPQTTTLAVPAYITLAAIMIGLMGEFYSRRHTSEGWWNG